MNKINFIKNYKLLIEDLKIPIASRINIYKNKDDFFKVENKTEVLYLYRHMIKNIPRLHNNLFENRCAYEEIKFYFREGSRETDYEVINVLKNTCYTIIEKINMGVFPPFPKYKA